MTVKLVDTDSIISVELPSEVIDRLGVSVSPEVTLEAYWEGNHLILSAVKEPLTLAEAAALSDKKFAAAYRELAR